MWTTRRHLPLCLLLVLLLLLSHSFILTTIGRLIPGAFGPIHPPSSSSPPSTTQGRWSWSYLDPTPVQLTPSSSSSHVQPQPQAHPDFPFTYGVSDRDTRDKAGERFIPAIRYAHATVVSEESLFITHGYHYDISSSGGATWLSDTWRFDFASHRWSRLHDHVTHPLDGPVARYACVATMVSGDLFLHGGDDGGNARRLASYQHAVYGDVWRFVLHSSPTHRHRVHSWVRIRATLSSQTFGHASYTPLTLPSYLPLDDLYRAQHAAVLVPFSSKSISVTWDETATADDESTSSATDTLVPYWLVSHGLTSLPATHSIPSSSSSSNTHSLLSEHIDVRDTDDTFLFSFRSKQWRLLRTSDPKPTPRFGHALVYVPTLPVGQSELEEGQEGSVFLYGGFSRSGENQGDLWMLSLQASASHPAFTWTRLHATYPSGSALSPDRRAYHNMHWTSDGFLHVFGGARCEPGCVCSAEWWRWDMARGLQMVQEEEKEKEEDAKLDTRSSSAWILMIQSPHSPSSASYPSREASGSPARHLYAQAQDSGAAGYPVHRYKQTLVMTPLHLQLSPPHASSPSTHSSAQSPAWSFVLFGGESYNPSAYLHDLWQMEYSPPLAPTSASASASASATATTDTAFPPSSIHHALYRTLHASPVPYLDTELDASLLRPPSDFHRYEPPEGWNAHPYTVRPQRVLRWRAKDEVVPAEEAAWDAATMYESTSRREGVGSDMNPMDHPLLFGGLLIVMLLLTVWRVAASQAQERRKRH